MLELNRTMPRTIRLVAPNEREVAYYAALDLVAWIDEALTNGTAHLWRKSNGCLITKFDEALQAILSNDLCIGDAPPRKRELRVYRFPDGTLVRGGWKTTYRDGRMSRLPGLEDL